MTHIGIFDTGFGGQYAAHELAALRPDDTFTVVDDKAHLPYGLRTEREIIDLTDKAIQPLLSSCDVIVIACNTATTIAINRLRKMHPDMPFVGFEPMIKTAARATQTGKIAILATPATLRSSRYQQLKQQWAEGVRVAEPDCSTWAGAIEAQTFDKATAVTLAKQLADGDVDVISLACTHYLYLQAAMQKAVGAKARILSPLTAVNSQINRVLKAA
jgi:glutamate racemase